MTATSLIKSPLAWQMADAPVPHSCFPVLAERGGTQLKTPRATVLVDTREQNPFDLSRFGWFAGVEKKALTLGDYSVADLENVCWSIFGRNRFLRSTAWQRRAQVP
jgi:hypothetical protein